MLRYILWRVAVMVPTLLIISGLVFTIIELPPGDYFESYIAELQAQGENVNTEQIDALRKEYGFDKPMIVRYVYWLGGMFVGDFGYSFEYQLPVSDVVGDRLWLTMLVSFVTIIFTWLVAFPIGIVTGVLKRGDLVPPVVQAYRRRLYQREAFRRAAAHGAPEAS